MIRVNREREKDREGDDYKKLFSWSMTILRSDLKARQCCPFLVSLFISPLSPLLLSLLTRIRSEYAPLLNRYPKMKTILPLIRLLPKKQTRLLFQLLAHSPNRGRPPQMRTATTDEGGDDGNAKRSQWKVVGGRISWVLLFDCCFGCPFIIQCQFR